MEIRPEVLMVVLGCAAVTVAPRVLPLVLMSRIALPAWLRAWLGHVPVSILAALLAQELLLSGKPSLASAAAALLAAVPAFAVAAWTRSILAAVGAGVLAMALLRAGGWS
jgi:branched-subunit amino acid transport protein